MLITLLASVLHKPQVQISPKVEAAPATQTVAIESTKPQPQPEVKPEPKPEPVKAVQAVAPKPVGVTNCGDNPYKQFIYQHESGCRTNAVNSIGCAGLGQACPGTKLPCSLSDWVCQTTTLPTMQSNDMARGKRLTTSG